MSFISSLMAKDSVNTLDALNAFNQEMGVTEAQQKAIDLGIYEIVRNVALNGGDMYIPTEVEWEGCRVIFDEAIRQQQMQQQHRESSRCGHLHAQWPCRTDPPQLPQTAGQEVRADRASESLSSKSFLIP